MFLRDWTGLTLDGLYERMQSMPPDGSENLSDDAYVDIISYVLERNGFPSGDAELSAGLLGHVRVEGEDGPGVVPNFALVRVVGCLAGDGHAGWQFVVGEPRGPRDRPRPLGRRRPSPRRRRFPSVTTPSSCSTSSRAPRPTSATRSRRRAC